MFPSARLVVHQGPVQADHPGEEKLRQAVLAHDRGRAGEPLLGELHSAVVGEGDQPLACQPRGRFAGRGGADVQSFYQARTQRRDALLPQLVEGAEVHLGTVD